MVPAGDRLLVSLARGSVDTLRPLGLGYRHADRRYIRFPHDLDSRLPARSRLWLQRPTARLPCRTHEFELAASRESAGSELRELLVNQDGITMPRRNLCHAKGECDRWTLRLA